MESKTSRKRRKIKKNAQIVFEMLEEKGVKVAPKKAKEERWTGKWKEITNIDLSRWEDQTKSICKIQKISSIIINTTIGSM